MSKKQVILFSLIVFLLNPQVGAKKCALVLPDSAHSAQHSQHGRVDSFPSDLSEKDYKHKHNSTHSDLKPADSKATEHCDVSSCSQCCCCPITIDLFHDIDKIQLAITELPSMLSFTHSSFDLGLIRPPCLT